MTNEEKQLRQQITTLEMKTAKLTQSIADQIKARDEAEAELKKLQTRLDKLTGGRKISVTDHAVVRYLERAKEINIEAIRGAIATDELLRVAEALGGSGKFPLGDGLVVMKNYAVITYLSDKNQDG